MAGSRKRRSRKDGPPRDEARRKQLLELGLKLFGQMSFAEVSIDDIAARAGISRGLLYHYFKGKRGFYTETVRVGRTSVTTKVTVEVERRHGSEPSIKVTEAEVVYVHVDQRNRPIPVHPPVR